MHAVDLDTELAAAVERAGGSTRMRLAEYHCGPGDARVVWTAFKELIEVGVDRLDGEGELVLGTYADDDLLLFESGISSADPAAMHFSVTRQLSFSIGDDYAGMYMLNVDVRLDASPELAALPVAQLWGHGGPRAPLARTEHGEFAGGWTGGARIWSAAVEQHPAFRATVLADTAQLVKFDFHAM